MNNLSKHTFLVSSRNQQLSMLLLLVLAVFLFTSQVCAIESVQSGRWGDPSTWDTLRVPNMVTDLNDVNINPGHNVYLAEEGVSRYVTIADAAWARNLTIFPTASLTATFTAQPANYGAVPMMIWANQFVNNGTVSGAPSAPIAGNINISGVGINPTFLNNGTISGFDGSTQGGWIDIGGFMPKVPPKLNLFSEVPTPHVRQEILVPKENPVKIETMKHQELEVPRPVGVPVHKEIDVPKPL